MGKGSGAGARTTRENYQPREGVIQIQETLPAVAQGLFLPWDEKIPRNLDLPIRLQCQLSGYSLPPTEECMLVPI